MDSVSLGLRPDELAFRPLVALDGHQRVYVLIVPDLDFCSVLIETARFEGVGPEGQSRGVQVRGWGDFLPRNLVPFESRRVFAAELDSDGGFLLAIQSESGLWTLYEGISCTSDL